MKTKIVLLAFLAFSFVFRDASSQCNVRITEENGNSCTGTVFRYEMDRYDGNDAATLYVVDYGDDVIDTLSHNELNPSGVHFFTHTYTTTSCGQPEIVEGSTTIREEDTFLFTLTVICPSETKSRSINPIRIGDPPTADFTFSPEIGCINEDITFTNASDPGLSFFCEENPTYRWNFGDGSSQVLTTPDAVTHRFTSPGVYSVTLLIQHDCGTYPITKDITILDIPQPAFEIGAGAELMLVDDCSNNFFAFSSASRSCVNTDFLPLRNVSPGANPSSVFRWEVSPTNGAIFDNADLTQPTNQIRFTQPGSYTVSLLVEDQCAAGGTGSNESCIVVNVKGIPEITQIESNPEDLCDLDDVIFQPTINHANSNTTDADILSYQWQVTTSAGAAVSFSFVDSNPSLVLNDVPSGDYRAILTLNTTCGMEDRPVEFSVQDIPEPLIEVNPVKICVGTPYTIRSSIAADSYRWLENGIEIGDTRQLDLTKNSVGTINYELIVVVNGCENNVLTSIAISSPPTLTVIPNDICSGESVGLIATTDAGSATNWQWVPDAALNFDIPSGTGASINTAIENTSNDTVRATLQVSSALNGCTTNLDTSLLVIPNARFIPDFPSLDICSGEEATAILRNQLSIPIDISWVVTDNSGGVAGASSGLVNDVVSTADFSPTLVNNSGTVQSVTYNFSATTTLGSCESNDISITVDVQPAVDFPSGFPSNIIICSGESVDADLAGTSSLTFSWMAGANPNVSGSNNGSGTILNDVLTSNNNAGDEIVVYTIVPEEAGCSGNSRNLTVTIKPKPLVTINHDDPVVICGAGSTTEIMANSTVGGTTFEWFFGTETSPRSTSSSYSVSQIGSYRLVGKTGDDCTSEISFDVVLRSLIDPTISASKTEACEGEVINLGLNGTGINSVTWFFSADNTSFSALQSSNTLEAKDDGYYFAEVNKAEACPEVSDTLKLTFFELPDPEIVVGGGVNTVCPNEVLNLQAVNINSNVTIKDYLWTVTIVNGGNAVFSDPTAANTTLTFPDNQGNNALTYVITLTLTTEDNCKDLIEQVITLSPRPISSFSIQNQACIGETVAISNTSQFANSYNWSVIPAGPVFSSNTEENPSISFPTSTDSVTYTITLEAGQGVCKDVETQKIRVYPVPIIDFDITPASDQCTDSEFNFINQSSTTISGQNQSNIDFTWSVDGTSQSNTVDFTESFENTSLPPADRVVDITLSGELNGCIISNTKQITIYPSSLAAFNIEKSAACAPLTIDGDLLELIDYEINDTYTWFILDEMDQVLAGPTTGVIPPAYVISEPETTVKIRLIADNEHSCEADTLDRSVTTFAKPVANFTMSERIGCTPFNPNFTNNSDENSTYIWRFSDGQTINSFEDNDLIFTNNTFEDIVITAELEVTSENGCLNTFSDTFTVKALPEVYITGPFTHCPNDPPVQLTYNAPNDAASNVTWVAQGLPDGAITPDGIFNPAIAGTNTGGHRVTLRFTESGPEPRCTAEVDTLIFVNQLPQPSFEIDPFYCINTPIEFTNLTPGLSGTTVAYRWDYGDGTTGNTVDGIHTYLMADTVTVELVVTTGDGCVNSISAETIIVTPPEADFDVTLTPADGCGPVEVAFDNKSDAPAGTFLWDFGNGTTSTEENPLPITYNSNPQKDTTYTITLYVTNVCLTDTLKKDILIKTAPTAAFNFNFDKACDELPITINNTSFGNAGNFIFNFGDGTPEFRTDGNNPFTHVFRSDIPRDTVYTVRLITSNDCGIDTAYQDVLVVPNDIRAFIETNSPVVCQNEEALLIASGLETQEAGITWNVDGNIYTREDSVFHAFDTFGFKEVILTVDVPVCNSQASDTVQINVLRTPDIDFEIPETLCLNEVLPIENIGPDFDETTLWKYGNDSTYEGANPPGIFYEQEGDYKLSMELTSANGCKTLVEKDLQVKPLPVPNFEIAEPLLCSFKEINFINNSSGAVSYLWDFDDVANSTSIVANPSHRFQSDGLFDVELVAFDESNLLGCSDTINQVVQINPTPKADFSLETIYDCGVNSIQVVNNSEAPVDTRFFWQWSAADLPIVGEDPGVLTVDNFNENEDVNSQLFLIAQSSVGCTDTSEVEQVVTPAFMFDVNTPEDPSTSLAFIPDSRTGKNSRLRLNSTNVGAVTLQIFDRWGNTVFISDEIDFSWDGVYRGKLVEPGDYVMLIEYSDCSGRKEARTKQVPLKVLRDN